jgi:hypothetical protein
MGIVVAIESTLYQLVSRFCLVSVESMPSALSSENSNVVVVVCGLFRMRTYTVGETGPISGSPEFELENSNLFGDSLSQLKREVVPDMKRKRLMEHSTFEPDLSRSSHDLAVSVSVPFLVQYFVFISTGTNF